MGRFFAWILVLAAIQRVRDQDLRSVYLGPRVPPRDPLYRPQVRLGFLGLWGFRVQGSGFRDAMYIPQNNGEPNGKEHGKSNGNRVLGFRV